MAGAVLRDNRIAACASHLSLKFPSGILPALPRSPSMTGCSSSNWLRRSLLGKETIYCIGTDNSKTRNHMK